MKFFKYIDTIPASPTIDGNPASFEPGDLIAVRKGSAGVYRWETHKVAADGAIYSASITLDEWTRLNQLQQADINKLKQDYTKAELDTKFETIIAGEKGSIGLSDVPPTEDGIYRAKESGTYANLGGLVVESGKSVWFLKSGNMWSIYSTIDGAPATGIVESGNTGATSGNEVYKNIQPLRTSLQKDVTSDIIKETKLLGAYSATEFEIASIASGILFSIKMNQGDQFNITRPSVQSNRFRVLTSSKATLPTLNDLLLNLYNDSSNTKLSYDGIMPVTGWLCVYLDNRLGTDPDKPSLESVQLYITKTVNVNSELSNIKQGYMDKDEYLSVEYTPTSNNLFNKDAPLNNKDVIDGVLTDRSSVIMSNPIPVKKDEAYTISGKTISIVGRNLYFFNNAEDTIVRSSILGGSGVGQTFTSPINGVMRTLSKDLSFDWRDTMQVNKGSVALPYEPWSPPIERDIINPDYLPEIQSKSTVKSVIVDMARGSIGISGLIPSVQQDKAWKDNEFHNNFRTPRYLNLKGKFSINKNELTAYNVYLHQYDDRFAFISRTLLTENDFECDSRTEYVKLHVNRTDSGAITSLPPVKINGGFSGDVYTMNNNETGNNVMSFMVQVTPNANGRDMLDQGQANGPAQYDSNSYYTHGIIRLPKNYDPKGAPVRMIYFAHSSAGTQLLDFYYKYKPYVQYLLDEGYAVFDMFSWSSKYPGVTQYMGTPDNSACSQSVYNYIVQNFNVRTDGVHLFGKSQGGVQVGNIQYTTSIPIKSKVYLAATPTPFGNNFGYSNPEKEASMRSFGIEGDVSPIFIVDGDTTVTPYYSAGSRAFLLQHAEKFVGYIPCWCGVIMDSPEEQFPDSYKPIQLLPLNYTKIDHVPSKAFCAPDDSWIYQHLKAVQKWTRKGGGIFEFRDMQTGSGDPHHTTDTAGPFVNVQTKLGGVLNDIPVAWVEMLQFFKRFE